MDKVYARIISVSLLLSLCGVGVVSPRLCRAIFISEAEQTLVKQANAASPSSSDKGKIPAGSHWAKLPLRRILSSLSVRLSEMCAAGRVAQSLGARCPSTFNSNSKAEPFADHQLAALTGCSDAHTEFLTFVRHYLFQGSPSLLYGRRRIMPIRAGPSQPWPVVILGALLPPYF